MSLVPVPPRAEEEPETRLTYLNEKRTVSSWLVTIDHKRIGVLFLFATTGFLLVGGLLAMVLRTELLTPDPGFLTNDGYNRTFTMHGVIMVWLFMIPAIPTAFGNFVLPMMIGAREVAFPRLNLASLYIFVAGSLIVLGGLFVGGADTGWTFYTPYSAVTPSAIVPVLVGVFVLGWSTILTGLNLITTTHTMRARGLTWHRMPLFVWAIYGTSVIQVAATPVLGMALSLVAIDHVFDWGVFDPARGGDPVLYQHLFWFYSHPAVYIMILPSMGVVSEVVMSSAHRSPQSYKLIAWSTFGIAFVGFLSWGHHMFVAGMSVVGVGAFGATSMLVAIFSAIKVFTWTGTFREASVSVTTPLLYILIFLYLFVFGGMTGVAVATTSLDVHWHDTYFVVAHFHFIMVGATLTAWLAALHYWFPLMTGRLYPERLGYAAAAGTFLGFNLTFVPQFLLGNAGMVRRAAMYPPELQPLHVLSTAGSWMLGLAIVLPLAYLSWAAIWGRRSPRNPWESRSYEWRGQVPAHPENHTEPLDLGVGPYDYHRELDP